MLLSALKKRPGRAFTRAQLLDLAYPNDAEVYDRTIDSHIKNIRTKVKAVAPEVELIRSIYGVGYAFGA
ncbi:MAG: winged helix-turn-helix domain-containing protein [Paracoccaceae bacterium]